MHYQLSNTIMKRLHHQAAHILKVVQGSISRKCTTLPSVIFFLLLMLNSVADGHELHLTNLFKKVKDTVVVVHTSERGWKESESHLTTARGIGSGVIISNDGLIMTAAHVVQVADAIEVEFRDGTSCEATVVSSSPRTDLALLKLTKKAPFKLEKAMIGDSNQLRVGDALFAIGAPNGITYTMTSGHVSNVLSTGIKALQSTEIEVVLTDAGIDVGNSGGPIFNSAGEVVGIVSQFFPFQQKSGSLGAAVSIQSATEILLKSQPFWSGMELYLLPTHLARALNIPTQGTGFMVQRVAKYSPAEKAGLMAGTIRSRIGDVDVVLGGDIIIEVNGQQLIQNDLEMATVIETLSENKQVTLTVLRAGKILETSLRALE